MTFPTEQQMTLISDARTARAVLQQAGPVFKLQHDDALARLKSMFRQGNYTESRLAAGIAELCAIDDIVERFNAKIEAGESTQKELHNV